MFNLISQAVFLRAPKFKEAKTQIPKYFKLKRLQLT